MLALHPQPQPSSQPTTKATSAVSDAGPFASSSRSPPPARAAIVTATPPLPRHDSGFNASCSLIASTSRLSPTTSSAAAAPIASAPTSQRQPRPQPALLIVNGKVVASPALGTSGGRPKKYICAECSKGYTRPVRLQEHERVHTGERPFKCTECPSTFARDSHLKAHARIHTTEAEKRYECDRCDKKFWTNQHLKKHIEIMHQGKTYDCSRCDESFRKHHLLRTHVAEVHSTPGTFPFICDFEGCDKSFKQNTHLKAHIKTHDPSRYLCVHPDCASLPLLERQHPTWSALQKHAKAVHPPTCPYPECGKKTFTTGRGLRNHLAAVHEGSGAEEGVKRSRRKRRRGGRGRESSSDDDNYEEEDEARETDAADEQTSSSEWEREDDQRERRMLRDFAAGGKKKRRIVLAPESVWACRHGACKRSFKSCDALEKHVEAVHTSRRTVPVVEVPVRRASQSRSRSHSRGVTPAARDQEVDCTSEQGGDDDDESPPLPPLPPLPRTKRPTPSLIDMVTGFGYAPTIARDTDGTLSTARSKRKYPCPWLSIDEMEHDSIAVDDEGQATHELDLRGCEYWFARVYDVQRHLRSEHRVIVDRDVLSNYFEDGSQDDESGDEDE